MLKRWKNFTLQLCRGRGLEWLGRVTHQEAWAPPPPLWPWFPPLLSEGGWGALTFGFRRPLPRGRPPANTFLGLGGPLPALSRKSLILNLQGALSADVTPNPQTCLGLHCPITLRFTIVF